MKNIKEIKFIDLFAGIGGFRLGLERANDEENKVARTGDNQRKHSTNIKKSKSRKQSDNNFTCVWSNDFNKYANQVYTARFGEANHSSGDIRGINTENIPDHDLLCGGFPCQAFSVAGKRLGFKETRGTLFFEICRIAETKRPRLLLLENVKGLLSHDGGRTFATILNSLEELGYWWEYQVLNSKYFGVPQNRERVFIIGHLGGESGREIFPITETSQDFVESCEETQGERARLRVANTLSVGGSGKERNLIGAVTSGQDKDYGKNLIANTMSSRYYKDGSENLIAKSALIHSRGLETRHDDVSHCLKGGGGGSSKNMLVSKSRENKYRIHRDDDKKSEIQGYSFFESEGIIDIVDNHPKNILVQPLRFLNRNQKNFGDDAMTVDPTNSTGIRQGTNIRRLTPIECERLQGFPDNWTKFGYAKGKTVTKEPIYGEEYTGEDDDGNPTFKQIITGYIPYEEPVQDAVIISDTQRYKCLGNAVTVNVIEFLGQRILDSWG